MNSGRTPEEYRDFFAEVFAAMDAEPKARKARVFSEGLEIGLSEGEPVFRTDAGSVRANFRRRWLAEHPVPVRPGRTAVFTFLPTSGNRVKVRVK